MTTILLMRTALVFFCFLSITVQAQNKTANVIIVTTDGLRWQELFKGMDSSLAKNRKFNQDDSAYIFKTFWADDASERRRKLMPFTWSTLSSKGQIYGNRELGNKMDVANSYRFSYPGYSELMTGYVDTAINTNAYPPNPNENILAFLNRQKNYQGSVAAFGAWYAFDRILNEKKSNLPVINAFDTVGGKNPTANERLINLMLKDSYRPWLEDECLDVFTHYGALEWLRTRKPRVLYIAYGETDEWAHSGLYRSYLDATRQVDAWLKELWDFIQSDPQYRNKTTLIITTDHGRGDVIKDQWTSHGKDIEGANEIWLAVMGPDTPPTGEMRQRDQIYLEQCAQTIAKLLKLDFTTTHPVAPHIKSVFKASR